MSGDRDAFWLVFAKGKPPYELVGLTRARSGIFWCRVHTMSQAQAIAARLKAAPGIIKAWYRAASETPARGPRHRAEDDGEIAAFLAKREATEYQAGRAYGSRSSTDNKAILSKRQRGESGRRRNKR